MQRHSRLQTDKGAAPVVFNDNAASGFVVVCEHAGQTIPGGLENLGLTRAELESHIAWDPGAAAVAEALAMELDAVLVKQRYSRLVYDCNRPPSSPDAMREISENTLIPGNKNLSADERQWRIEQIYQAFHDSVAEQLDRYSGPVLITVHSFTPVYLGKSRTVEIGVLHDEESRLADAILAVADEERDVFDRGVVVRRNEPYGPEDGVTHTLNLHSEKRQILNVMIEIKSTLIKEQASQKRYGQQLAHVIKAAVSKIEPTLLRDASMPGVEAGSGSG